MDLDSRLALVPQLIFELRPPPEICSVARPGRGIELRLESLKVRRVLRKFRVVLKYSTYRPLKRCLYLIASSRPAIKGASKTLAQR